MSKPWFALAVAGVVGVFCLAIGQEQPPGQNTRRARAQQAEPGAQAPEGRVARGRGAGQVGRYQMTINERGGQVVVCDTTTGRCWVANLNPGGGQGWRDLGGVPDGAPRLTPPVIEGTTITPVPAVPAAGASRLIPATAVIPGDPLRNPAVLPPAPSPPRIPQSEPPPEPPSGRE